MSGLHPLVFFVGAKQLGQLLSAVAQPRTHGELTRANDARDLGDRALLDIVQDHHRAVLLAHALEHLVHLARLFSRLELLALQWRVALRLGMLLEPEREARCPAAI